MPEPKNNSPILSPQLPYKPEDGNDIHSEDIQDIIENPPHALLRWGMTWILVVIAGIMLLAHFIHYPDVIKTHVRINATNAPKKLPSKVSGNIERILVEDFDTVSAGQILAWLESTSNHGEVLELYDLLLAIRQQLSSEQKGSNIAKLIEIKTPEKLKLGELQSSYQNFFQQYVNFRATTSKGILLQRRSSLARDIQNIDTQRDYLEQQKELQQKEYSIAETTFKRHEKLAEQKVISPSEFQQQEAVLLARQHPLRQTETALLHNETSKNGKLREMEELENQIGEGKAGFMQALNSLISEVDSWKTRHLVTAPQAGTVVFAGVIQENQFIETGQELFYINPGSGDFFGEINIPQYNMGKVKSGQRVLVKLDSYPFEEFGAIEGQISHFSHVPVRDSIFLSKVSLDRNSVNGQIFLRTGLTGTAEIVTQDASLLSRLYRNLTNIANRR